MVKQPQNPPEMQTSPERTNPPGVDCPCPDTPELLAQLEELRRSMARYHDLIESIDDWLWEIDERGVYTYASSKVRDLLGYEPEEVLGRRYDDLMGQDEAHRVNGIVGLNLATHQPFSLLENTLIRKDGSTVTVETSGRPIFDFEGHFRGYRGVDRNITERQRAEAALLRTQIIIDRATEAVFWVGPSGKFEYVNEATCKSLGYTREELYQMEVPDIIPDFLEKEFQENRRRILEHGEATLEALHRTKDGRLFPVEITVTLMELDGQSYMLGFARDITERKRAEEERRAFYRDTITSATGGKLIVCEPADIRSYISRANISMEMRHAAEIGLVRHQIREFFSRHGLQGERLDDMILGAGEAIGNALKHAGCGFIYAGADETIAWVAVTDQGPGIESLILPKAVLQRGFSTKASLGLGYSIILEVSDRVLLSTGRGGTEVVLIKYLRPQKESPIEAIPDTWRSVPDLRQSKRAEARPHAWEALASAP